jgi:hypothetical protein
MALHALTAIKVGGEDGNVVLYDEGDTIDESDFTDEQLDQLKEIGSVGELRISPEEADKERQKLLDRIAELEAQAAEAQGTQRLKPTENVPGSDVTLEQQLAKQEEDAVKGEPDEKTPQAVTPQNPTGEPNRTPAKKTASSGNK